MGFFWAEAEPGSSSIMRSNTNARLGASSSPAQSCPIRDSQKAPSRPEAVELVSEATTCPYEGPKSVPPDRSQRSPRNTAMAALNPLNWMPRDLSQHRESVRQTKNLPVEREISSIPRGASEDESISGNWEYPSPQQMYNALLRKGFTETPEDAVESMVAIHNFLNEGAWAEIVEWERRFGKGLLQGWRESRFGEEGSQIGARALPKPGQDIFQPKLIRFMGKSQDLTPKARMLQLLGWMYPTKFGGPPPFDRHDWFVERQAPDGRPQQVRYVIDYYSGPPEPTGQPVFYLDIRPALDRPAAPAERFIRWSRDVWWRASGARAREQPSS